MNGRIGVEAAIGLNSENTQRKMPCLKEEQRQVDKSITKTLHQQQQ